MRQKVIVCIRDVKIGEYQTLMVLHNQAEAKRLFLHAMSDPKSQLGKFPHDYTLHELGLFDPETGRITVHDLVVDFTPYTERDAVIAGNKLAEVTGG